MDFDKVIGKRSSVKKFLSKKPDWRDLIKAIEAGLNGPYAGNIGSVKFILVQDEDKIKAISEASQQIFVQHVDYLIVVCSNPKEVIKSFKERGEVYVRQQAGAAIENVLLKLVDLGLSGCWVGHFVEDHVRRILEIPEDIYVEAVIPVGYAFGKVSNKPKKNVDTALYFDKYKQKTMKPKRLVEAH